ncbi:P-loop containing nucleoside triphosphate hydrolase protein [Tirmania nivea]|nr:P-loop containing nucleoside triphosphate hydrolase protein [Tirmania nivea]
MGSAAASPTPPALMQAGPGTQNRRITLHIEVRLVPVSNVRPDSVTRCIRHWLSDNFTSLQIGQDMTEYIAKSSSPPELLCRSVEAIYVVEAVGSNEELLALANVELQIHTYKIRTGTGSIVSYLHTDDVDEQPAARILELPADQLDGSWDYLYYYPDVKTKLLHFITTIMFFADKQVNSKCISFNRLILLHGPPGSGKTSLCHALAQKLSIRLSSRFSRTRLVEINAHTLCSKWFSESGKLVGRLFDNISTMLEDEDLFVFVLIDEVESLASAREVMSGNEPIDSLRVVNALLTALDKLRYRKNVGDALLLLLDGLLILKAGAQVIVLTTTNLANTMDLAFLDRADIKQYIGCPGAETCYAILRSSLNELIRCQIIDSNRLFISFVSNSILLQVSIPPWSEASLMLYSQPGASSSKLWDIAKECAKRSLSGRALKKLPVLMHAEWIQQATCSIDEALGALCKCIHQEDTFL